MAPSLHFHLPVIPDINTEEERGDAGLPCGRHSLGTAGAVLRLVAGPGPVWSTLIGPAPTLLRSHWSSSYITALSLVQTFPSDAGATNLMP